MEVGTSLSYLEMASVAILHDHGHHSHYLGKYRRLTISQNSQRVSKLIIDVFHRQKFSSSARQ